MYQVKVIVSDDASEFEDMINKELKKLGMKVKKIDMHCYSSDWKFYATIIFEV